MQGCTRRLSSLPPPYPVCLELTHHYPYICVISVSVFGVCVWPSLISVYISRATPCDDAKANAQPKCAQVCTLPPHPSNPQQQQASKKQDKQSERENPQSVFGVGFGLRSEFVLLFVRFARLMWGRLGAVDLGQATAPPTTPQHHRKGMRQETKPLLLLMRLLPARPTAPRGHAVGAKTHTTMPSEQGRRGLPSYPEP